MKLRCYLFSVAILCCAGPVSACSDVGETFRVVGIDRDDVLNVRSGPGFKFSVRDTLPFNAKLVENLDHVPIVTCDGKTSLSRYEKDNQWTKIIWNQQGRYVYGWVKSRYLAE